MAMESPGTTKTIEEHGWLGLFSGKGWSGPDGLASKVFATVTKEFPASVDYEDIFSTLENLSDNYRTPKDCFIKIAKIFEN